MSFWYYRFCYRMRTSLHPLHSSFNELFRQFADNRFLRPRFAVIVSTGILTSLPSTLPLGFALGPD
jgi:hypothetical protein